MLLAKEGTILAANRAMGALGRLPIDLAGRNLAELTASPVESLRDYLRLCSRSREPVPGSIDLIAPSGPAIACRCHGAVVEHDPGRKNSTLFLRLEPKETAPSRFGALNLQLAERNEEIRRRRLAEERLREQREWLRVTLASIGDAVITTDEAARVTFVNPVAEGLTGWTNADAQGCPLDDVFRIVNQHTRRPVESPAQKVLKEGVIVGLANHTLLISRDGRETPIDDSGAPIRDAEGRVAGVVLVFRDVTKRHQVEEELEHQRRLLQTITDNAASMLLMMDPQGRTTFANPAAERITGFRAEELIGEPLHEKIHYARPDGRPYPVEECPLDNALPLQEAVRAHEDVFIRKDGTFFPVRCSARPVLRNGEPVATVIEAQDVSEESRVADALRKREERFRAIADRSVTGIAEVDLAGRYLFVNDRYCETLGRRREELLDGMRMQDVTHPDDLSPNLLRFERLVREGQPFLIEKRYVRPDGSIVWVNNSVSGVRGDDGRVEGVVAVSVDVTDRKRAEDELREANRRKDEFLAMLAHELRNPLAPIRSGLDLLGLMGTDGGIIEPMQQQVEHLVRLVDDLLDVSRIMRGKVELRRESVELASIVDRAVRTARPLIDARRHELSLELPKEPVTLDADPVRLSQVIANLLNNAAKYTEDGGRIRLSALAEDGDAVVTVSDTGIGIDSDLLPAVFDLFTQASPGIDRSEGGLGIGLTLVKSLVEMHGGSVTARSDGLGKGSAFTVRLPRGTAAAPQAAKESRPDSTGAYRLLVVDDNVAAAKMLSKLIQKLGKHDVVAAHDGRSALESAGAYRPDVILLDIGLPRMDGYEVARRLRQRPEFERTLIVALTGYGAEEDRRRSLQAGCDDHLVKPPGIETLRQVLAHPKLRGE